jgi:ribonuclease HI
VIAQDQTVGHVTELGGGSPHTTNNRMELSGAIAALAHCSGRSGHVAVYADSTYVVQGITQWVWGWRTRGWKTAQGGDALKRDLWEQLFDLVAARGRRSVEWRWVRGHVGTVGNERADQISVAFAVQEDAGCMMVRSTAIRYGSSTSCRTTPRCRGVLPAPSPVRPRLPPTRMCVVGGIPMPRHVAGMRTAGQGTSRRPLQEEHER